MPKDSGLKLELFSFLNYTFELKCFLPLFFFSSSPPFLHLAAFKVEARLVKTRSRLHPFQGRGFKDKLARGPANVAPG